MKLEKRSDGAPIEQPPAAAGTKGNKSVVVYIMVLFIAAFLLMAWSFFTHQRSNTEALGRIQSSVSVMQEVQELQEQVIQLQTELAEAKEAADVFEDANETSRNQASHLEYTLERTKEAMEWFWQLNEAYLKENFELCETMLAADENVESPMEEYLTPLAADRYQEIKELMEAQEPGK